MKVAVAVGSGVMLGNGVVVEKITAVSEGMGSVAITVVRGTDVRTCARLLAVRLIEDMLGAVAVPGSVVRHADATSNTAVAIKIGTFALFMTSPG